KVRPIPPLGKVTPDAGQRKALEEGLAELGRDLEALAGGVKPALRDLLPDVEVFHKAVRYALADNTFYTPGEVEAARKLLAQGRERAKALRAGKAPWASATGLVVRGYRSKIDGS